MDNNEALQAIRQNIRDEKNDIAAMGYSFFTVQFADGEYRVAVCDYSEAWLYSYTHLGALAVAFVVYSCIAIGFTRRLFPGR